MISKSVQWLEQRDKVSEKLVEAGKNREYTSFVDVCKLFNETECSVYYVYAGKNSWFDAEYNTAKQNWRNN